MTPERRAGRAGSATFAAMRRALLAEVARIPPGQVVEVGRLAASLTIPARHAAHILSRLAPDEADLVPRHRVIRAQGIFGPPTRRTPRIMQQVASLRAEGHGLSAAGRLEAAPGRTWEPDPGNPTLGTRRPARRDDLGRRRRGRLSRR